MKKTGTQSQELLAMQHKMKLSDERFMSMKNQYDQ